ncbi:beta carbonic anhydrase, clade B [Arcobacter venerupis]|uniref:Carbonic anhydrase n=1 Tax=Arcobacter venerupis TaxID=1054033 RepID=A0AAE7B5R5_9BACT|nr:carbonic anhydrase [Arcobacter venerupis]QKF65808.1 beta carbonic anhydrase, clade B [Arcobacter venerupis]RWS50315.1 carbonic anhydrase [Arcobacter venerupis]
MNAIKNLIRGNKLFRKYQFDEFKDDLSELNATGQKPEILFITCCDSRITIDFMVGSKPGDLFILRNIGNFVPPFSLNGDFHGTASAIEYAVSILNVSHIIVCGHSYCGACKSLYEDIPDTQHYINIKKWLQLGQEAKNLTLENKHLYQTLSDLYKATEKNSVICQVKNLLTYPAIKEKIELNNITIHGWYYNLDDGSIEYYDKNENSFKQISEYLNYY